LGFGWSLVPVVLGDPNGGNGRQEPRARRLYDGCPESWFSDERECKAIGRSLGLLDCHLFSDSPLCLSSFLSRPFVPSPPHDHTPAHTARYLHQGILLDWLTDPPPPLPLPSTSERHFNSPQDILQDSSDSFGSITRNLDHSIKRERKQPRYRYR
jgi:hypothetical protein